MSPLNLVVNGGSSNQVFGFNAPGPSTPVTTTPPVNLFTTAFSSKPSGGHHIYSSAKSGPFTQVTTTTANHKGLTHVGFVNTAECRNGHCCTTGLTSPTGRTFDEDHETSEHTVSKAISAKSFHTHRKISPPLNRPDHLRFSWQQSMSVSLSVRPFCVQSLWSIYLYVKSVASVKLITIIYLFIYCCTCVFKLNQPIKNYQSAFFKTFFSPISPLGCTSYPAANGFKMIIFCVQKSVIFWTPIYSIYTENGALTLINILLN